MPLQPKIMKTVLVAMSGGVDSSVAPALLKQEGYDLIGITMKTWGYDDFPEKNSGCCSLETIYSARNVADSLGFPHYTLDFTEVFNDIVIKDFIDSYMKGETPNPCVLCNKEIKWGTLLRKAEELGADYIATGHYARISVTQAEDLRLRYHIQTAADEDKDQSYALWRLSQYALSKTIFPLGNYKKAEIRKIAMEMGLKPARTPDSQEICFVPNNNYRELLQIRLPETIRKLDKGDIVYQDKKIGEHKGYPFYTIGQRRGLNISVGKPVYVSEIDAENNTVRVDDESHLYGMQFTAREINLMKYGRLEEPVRAKVRVRYKDEGGFAMLEQSDESHITVKFDTPRKAITPGQSAVFYEGEDVIGGGIIDTIRN
jgi:tRNA-specific 2-thiouridylase